MDKLDRFDVKVMMVVLLAFSFFAGFFVNKIFYSKNLVDTNVVGNKNVVDSKVEDDEEERKVSAENVDSRLSASISGGVISKQEGNTVYYNPKCNFCGRIYSGGGAYTLKKRMHLKSSHHCSKCKKRTEIIIRGY